MELFFRTSMSLMFNYLLLKIMKKIFLVPLILFSCFVYSQIIIGDTLGTSTDKTSVLLEFAKNSDTEKNNKGLILPYVSDLSSSNTPGTLLLHADGQNSRMKYFNGDIWVDLSGKDADNSKELALQKSKSEQKNGKVIIGSKDSSAEGVLVLESSSKAMVLPIVEDVNNIPSPSPGMIVYVKKEDAKRLAVFNGKYWSFWKSSL